MKRVLWFLYVLVIGCVSEVALSCNVPVFRYALERWERDLYQVIVVKNGPFTESEVQRAQSLKAETMLGKGYLNAQISLADISKPAMRETLMEMYPAAVSAAGDKATLTLFYPRDQENKSLIWSAAFGEGSVDRLRAAAGHAPLAEALLNGSSAVYVLVESGEEEADEQVFRMLNESVANLETVLEIPEGIVGTNGEVTGGRLSAEEARAEDPANQLKSGIPLKIDFHVIRLAKSEDNEILRSILVNMQEGLVSHREEAMVFPVFGRGRVLPPMVGDAIHHENMEAAAKYLCGACSCQMKAQNPGIDSLTDLDWFGYLDGSGVIQSHPLPPLAGFLDEATSAVAEVADEPPSQVSVLRNTVIVCGVLLVVSLLSGFWIAKSDQL